MKRTELRRKVGLKRGGRLRAISEKKRAVLKREVERVKAEGRAFHAAIIGEVCVVCGRTNGEAWRESGYGHQAHHGVPQSVLKALGLHALLWDPGNAVCVCTEPCHRRHSDRIRRIRLAELPARIFEFVARHDLRRELEKEYRA